MRGEHRLQLVDNGWGPRVEFVCTFKKGANCHKRPADADVESWGPGDPTIDTDECWAVSWVEAEGIADALYYCGKKPLPVELTGPIKIWYDEGVSYEEATS
jgi:hypothetical protein